MKKQKKIRKKNQNLRERHLHRIPKQAFSIIDTSLLTCDMS